MGTAFGISEDDIAIVIEQNITRFTGDKARVDAAATELINEVDHERAERAALKGGTDMDDQTMAAYQDIAEQLETLGHFLPSPAETPKGA